MKTVPFVPQANEEVRAIPGYLGYFATSDGRIASVWTAANQNRASVIGQNLHECRPSIVPTTGYKSIKIRVEGRPFASHCVHELVALAFHGEKPEWAEQVRHLDGVRLNCRSSNLKWGTCKENAADTILHGRHARGSQVKISRLTEDVIPEIRRQLECGERVISIALRMSVSRGAIYGIRQGRVATRCMTATGG